jgi:predicted permease
MIDVSLDFRVLGFALALSILAGVLPGIASAWRASKPGLLPALKGESRVFGGGMKSRLRDFMVVAEVALSLVLITAAGLLLRSWSHYAEADPGFETENALIMTVRPGSQNYDRDQAYMLFRELMERIDTMGAVQATTLTDRVPLGMGGSRTVVSIGGEDCALVECPEVGAFRIGPNYFQTLGIPLLSGRSITGPLKRNVEDVAVVNESMSRRFWPGRNPVGLWLKIGEKGRRVQIIGLAADAKSRMLSEAPAPSIYLPLRAEDYSTGLTVVTRVRDEPRRYVTALREQLNALDATLPAFELKTMSEHLELALWAPRTAAIFIGAFGILALLLTLAGYYGVIFCSVSQRCRELAIRGALGATRGSLIVMILRQGMRLTAAGMIFGVLGAIVLAHIMTGALFGIGPMDPISFSGTLLLLAFTTFIACFIPAHRATRADAMAVLREE